MKSLLITDINKLINQGFSYTEIAKKLTDIHRREVTKNAVSGAVYRSRQRGNIVKATKQVIKSRPQAVKTHVGTQLIDLKHNQCHYPFGEPRQAGFHYCGAHVHLHDYCLEHYKACYQPNTKGKK